MIFLRHPVPDVAPGTCYGRTDLDITVDGEAQIRAALAATPKLTRLVASPAKRCRRLALALAERDAIKPGFDPRLWEMDMGAWEGLAWHAIDRKASDHWLADPVNRPTPGGESFAELMQRVEAVIGEHLDNEVMTTGFVCHAGPIRAAQMLFYGLSFGEAFAETPAYAEPIRLTPPSPAKARADER